MRSITPMRFAKIGYIIMSAVFCAVGTALMIRPEVSVKILGAAVGVGLIVFGIVKIIGYFSKDLYRLAFQYDLEFGVILAAIGTVIMLRPKELLSFMIIAIGVAVFADALFKLRIAADSRRFGIRSWAAITIVACFTLTVGLVLIIRPWDSAEMLVSLLGAALLAEGVLNLCVAVSTVKIIKKQYPDVIEADYREVEDDKK